MEWYPYIFDEIYFGYQRSLWDTRKKNLHQKGLQTLLMQGTINLNLTPLLGHSPFDASRVFGEGSRKR